MNKESRGGWGARRILFPVFVLLSLGITLFPFAMMLLESVTPPGNGPRDFSRYHPDRWTLENFSRLHEMGDFHRFFLNSLVFAVGYTLLSLTLNSLAAYAFARLMFPGRDRLFTFLTLTMMIPSQVTMIPVFMIVKSMGLLNSYLGLIIPGCAHVYGIFTLRQFMMEIPEEVFAAARVDGCNELQVYWHIALPLARPMLATLAVTSFIYTWDQFLFPLVVMQDEKMFTLPVALVSLTSKFSGEWGALLAGGVLTTIPALLVFFFAQKQYFSGITAGAVKK